MFTCSRHAITATPSRNIPLASPLTPKRPHLSVCKPSECKRSESDRVFGSRLWLRLFQELRECQP
eukprot:3346496-Amphidinium_carterae.1